MQKYQVGQTLLFEIPDGEKYKCNIEEIRGEQLIIKIITGKNFGKYSFLNIEEIDDTVSLVIFN